MKRVWRWARHNALSVALLLTAISAGVAIYAVIQVQAERKSFIFSQCVDQNNRHKGTIKQLDLQIARLSIGAPVARRAQLNASKGFTVLLINQLAPYQDCQQVLATSTSR